MTITHPNASHNPAQGEQFVMDVDWSVSMGITADE
jgi:hypothetical protein